MTEGQNQEKEPIAFIVIYAEEDGVSSDALWNGKDSKREPAALELESIGKGILEGRSS